MVGVEKDVFEPRIIRTMNSQALGISNSLSSQPSSLSHSPANLQPRRGSTANANFMAPSVSPTASSTTPSVNYRVAQACDRCRSKKIRCDGKRPQCSQCAAVGFECKISDKLSRRAFPKGYTETLEERVRELEAENRRLVALCDLKDEQLHLVSRYSSKSHPGTSSSTDDDQLLQQLSSSDGGSLRVSSTNLYLLNKTSPSEQPNSGSHRCQGTSCSHSSHPFLHEKPVSTTLSDPLAISFEQNEAPGLPAVKALSSMANHEYSNQLACLVALSIPRSTEEILFIPQLLARLGQVFGLTSKQCIYTASLLASLKEPSQVIIPSSEGLSQIKTKSLWEIDDPLKFFMQSCKFNPGFCDDPDTLTFQEIEDLISLYFGSCHALIPVFNENEFYSYYLKFKDGLINGKELFGDTSSSFAHRSKSISYKIFACILMVVCQFGIMLKVKSENLGPNHKLSRAMNYYNTLIPALRSNPYFTVKTTSIKTLQLTSLLLFYFLNTGDVSSVYEVRGRIVSMAQQLRLHRCPSAVLGTEGSTMSKNEQGDRRLLFWGIYYLDVFSALQLGVPRLMKDHEIECALPLSDNNKEGVSLSDQVVKLEGQVSEFSLSLLRFSKILGNILDSIFKRGMTATTAQQVTLIHENALDDWRRGLPQNLKFQLDVNGTVDAKEFSQSTDWNQELGNRDKKALLTLYFMIKCLVHLPVLAAKPLLAGPNGEPDPDDTLAADDPNGSADRSSSYVLLQQAINTFLSVQSSLGNCYLPLAVNMPRIKAQFALLSARSTLDYTKGGTLFQFNKGLLLDVIKELETTKVLDIPGSLSWHSLILLDMAVNVILQPPQTKPEKLDKLLEKRLRYYNKLMGRPSTNAGSKRKKEDQNGGSGLKLTPVSSECESPAEKRVKLEHSGNRIPHKDDCKAPMHGRDDANGGVSNASHNNPHNAIAEAFHFDAVLNNNSFSNADLTAFFTAEGAVPNLGSGASILNLAGIENSAVEMPANPGNGSGTRNQLQMSFNDGLFRVPSNGDFLKDYYRVPGASSSQLNLMFMGSHGGGSGRDASHNTDNGAAMGPSVTAHPTSMMARGSGFTVDASLGLAPLLAWSPAGAESHDTRQSSHQAPTTIQARQQPAAGHIPQYQSMQTSHQDFCDDSAITMPARPQRGPRRRWNAPPDARDHMQHSTQNQNQGDNEGNLQELFQWQNSGF
ncbi:LAME_0G13278g1_1 [Lachancea meyersii CBS 8951]|uniref:LAME_0G13278g1_1 n=1 Tax=Lachancea meyersii CBS 8951 TaxID=1266667 RepID=A0A1G4K9Y2_9SACH|nr:LAME_0G13278g1_1 [Lachancea meyersii CBS 8951]